MRYLAISILLSLTLFGDEQIVKESKGIVVKIESVQRDKESTIKALLGKIQKAKPEDRRLLINRLKIQLRASNQAEKQKTMVALKEAFAKQQNKTDEHKHLRLDLDRGDKNCNMHQNNLNHQPKFRYLRDQREMDGNQNLNPNRINQGENHR